MTKVLSRSPRSWSCMVIDLTMSSTESKVSHLCLYTLSNSGMKLAGSGFGFIRNNQCLSCNSYLLVKNLTKILTQDKILQDLGKIFHQR